MPAPRVGQGIPVEEFVQTLTAQLDRAQDALALKARTGRPLTFALKDLSIDLRVFWETDARGRLVMRHAGPNEEAASTVKLGFTTITRSMVEENTVSLGLEEDPRALQELRGTNNLNDDDRRRLEMVGVRTVGQLRRLSSGANSTSVETYLGIPVMRLRAALEQAARPAVLSQEMGQDADGPVLCLRGVNLADDGGARVHLDGEPVEVLQASPSELVVRPRSHHREGRLDVFAQGQQVSSPYRLSRAPAELRKPDGEYDVPAASSGAASTEVEEAP
jgi:hypothetical protein